MNRDIPLDSLEATALRLIAARNALGKSQRYLCDKLHVQPNTWNQWEKARYLPDVLAMARLADLYGISLDWIFRGRADTMAPDLAEAVVSAFAALQVETAAG